jgi:shikimate kinase
MMGVGKSTIGKNIAKRLKLKFIDIDRIIETNEKRKIKEIFNDKGEGYFRKIEKKTTLEELKKDNSVIALGGGAFINKFIRKEIRNSCISFWLDLSLTTLLPRLKNSTKRPLLDRYNLEQSIIKIYSDRKKIYSESNYRIKCDSVGTVKIVNKIIKIYENSRNKN